MGSRDYDLHGIHVLQLATDGHLLTTERDALDTIATASGRRAEVVIVPTD